MKLSLVIVHHSISWESFRAFFTFPFVHKCFRACYIFKAIFFEESSAVIKIRHIEVEYILFELFTVKRDIFHYIITVTNVYIETDRRLTASYSLPLRQVAGYKLHKYQLSIEDKEKKKWWQADSGGRS